MKLAKDIVTNTLDCKCNMIEAVPRFPVNNTFEKQYAIYWVYKARLQATYDLKPT